MAATFYVPPSISASILSGGIIAFLALIVALNISKRGFRILSKLTWKLVPPVFVRRLHRPLRIAVSLLALTVVMALTLPLYFARITIHEDRLEVLIPPLISAALSKADIVKAFVVDWRTDGPYRPILRTFGASFMEYKAGWFKLAMAVGL